MNDLSDEEALDRLLEERVFAELFFFLLEKVPKHMPHALAALSKLPTEVFWEELTGGESATEKFLHG